MNNWLVGVDQESPGLIMSWQKVLLGFRLTFVTSFFDRDTEDKDWSILRGHEEGKLAWFIYYWPHGTVVK